MASLASGIQEPTRRDSAYFRCALQTHRVMQEYVEAQFREHPSIGPMLNISLYKTMTRLERHDALKTEVRALQGTIKEVKVHYWESQKGYGW